MHTCACGCHLLLPVIASLPIPSPGRQCPVSPSQTPGQTHPCQDYRSFPRTWETHWMASPSCRRDLSPPVPTFSLLIPHLTGPGHPARPILGPEPPADTVSTCVLGCMLGHSLYLFSLQQRPRACGRFREDDTVVSSPSTSFFFKSTGLFSKLPFDMLAFPTCLL